MPSSDIRSNAIVVLACLAVLCAVATALRTVDDGSRIAVTDLDAAAERPIDRSDENAASQKELLESLSRLAERRAALEQRIQSVIAEAEVDGRIRALPPGNPIGQIDRSILLNIWRSERELRRRFPGMPARDYFDDPSLPLENVIRHLKSLRYTNQQIKQILNGSEPARGR